jgi:GNAT superfamily N-acetyltransferase
MSLVGQRLARFEGIRSERIATKVRRLPFGIARLSPDVPLVWSMNAVEVTRPVAVSELLSAIDPVFRDEGLGHRMVATGVAEVAWTLVPALTDRGWRHEGLVTMVHDGVTRPALSTPGIGAVDLNTWAAHADAFVADEPWGRDPAVQQAMAVRDRRLAERVSTAFLMAADGSAGCHVYRHGRIAQIENVHVLSQARGEGLGRGLMAAALAACGDADTVFVVAGATDWPRDWYGRLGFAPVASSWELVLPDASTALP